MKQCLWTGSMNAVTGGGGGVIYSSDSSISGLVCTFKLFKVFHTGPLTTTRTTESYERKCKINSKSQSAMSMIDDIDVM